MKFAPHLVTVGLKGTGLRRIAQIESHLARRAGEKIDDFFCHFRTFRSLPAHLRLCQ